MALDINSDQSIAQRLTDFLSRFDKLIVLIRNTGAYFD
jgi:hypothetical protein